MITVEIKADLHSQPFWVKSFDCQTHFSQILVFYRNKVRSKYKSRIVEYRFWTREVARADMPWPVPWPVAILLYRGQIKIKHDLVNLLFIIWTSSWFCHMDDCTYIYLPKMWKNKYKYNLRYCMYILYLPERLMKTVRLVS